MWPESILRQFATVPPANSTENESEFHPPYNKLLNTLFPVDSDFVVAPLYLQDPRNPGYFIFLYEIHLVDKPVLILMLKPPAHLNVLSKRKAADKQIRTRMGDLFGK